LAETAIEEGALLLVNDISRYIVSRLTILSQGSRDILGASWW